MPGAGTEKTPGPGAYTGQGNMLGALQRQWPGISSHSAFGTNAVRLQSSEVTPGPGEYDPRAVLGDGEHFIVDMPDGYPSQPGREALRTALRDAGWSTQSFMFPEVQVRADWGETSKS